MESLLNQRYQWVRSLSKSQSNTLILAQDLAQQRLVVLKTSTRREEVEQELSLLSRLSHPGLVRAYERGVITETSGEFLSLFIGATFFTQEWLEGRLLAETLSTPSTAETTAQLGLSLAKTLSYLHEQHTLHGDLSPNNVMRQGDNAVLFDLGLSQKSGGTLPYAAPEALCGEATELSDLFSLGALLFECWAGRPWVDLSRETPQRALELVFTASPGPLPEGNKALAEVIYRLLQKNPTQRYLSAEHVIAALRRALGESVPEPKNPRARLIIPLIGRASELSWLQENASSSSVIVCGRAGVGKSRLIQAFFHWYQGLLSKQRESVLSWRGTWPMLIQSFAPHLTTQQRELSAACGVLLESLCTRIESGPCLFHLETSQEIAQTLSQHLRATPVSPKHPYSIIVECTGDCPEGSRSLGPLSKPDALSLAQWVKGEPLTDEEQSALALTEGAPAAIQEMLSTANDSFFARQASLLSRGSLRALLKICLVEGSTQELNLSPSHREELTQRGWLKRESTLRLTSEALRRYLLRELPHEAKEIAKEITEDTELPVDRRAALYELLGETSRAADFYEEAARRSLSCVDLTAAQDDIEKALQLSPLTHQRERRALFVEILLQRGALTEAAARITEVKLLPGESPTNAQLCSLAATIYARQGKHSLALQETIDGLHTTNNYSLKAQAARALLALGEPMKAKEFTAEIDEETPSAARLLEARGLIALHLGEPDAEVSFSRARELFSRDGDGASVARALSTIGMSQQAKGEHQRAAESFREALRVAGESFDLQSAATYAINLGAALHASAALTSAEEAYKKGLKWLEIFGSAAEKSSAYYNYATLCLDLCDLAVAEINAHKALQYAKESSHKFVEAYCYLLLGDLAKSNLQREAAESWYQRSCQLFQRVQNPRGEAYALAALCRVSSTREPSAALRRLREIKERAAATAEVAECEALCLAESQQWEAAQRLFAEATTLYRQRNELDRAWRTLALQSEAAQQSSPELALHLRAEAIAIVESLARQVPEDRKALFWRDSERRALLGSGGEYQEKKLSRILAVAKQLNLESDRERLLSFILETIIELVHAERGFLLTPDGDSLRVSCARHISGEELSPQMPSRSIAEEAAHGDKPVVTIDAEADPRFIQALSVSGLKLRSVLAAPLRAQGKLVGCVYVDDQRRRGAFDANDVALVREFGELAAIVLDNAQLQRENQKRQQEIERLNLALSLKVEEQQEELTLAREALQRSGAELRSKYNYSNIVGRSPKMRALFSLVDRVTDSELPVLLFGESGTGKELIAKAIHYNGQRAEKPLISENCAAIPEGLLESALFGHVKGSFTGAERERKGLFELAHKGTLFLDEIGETSPKMQAKLLRALQEREIRRVGGDRPIHVDVRIIAATNRDLKKMVEAGLFREDLYFRLAVVRVDLPPLRERPEDIPLLAQHFLTQAKLSERIKISSRAMSRLASHQWPGNIRELENEITRAALLCDGVIEERHLSAALLQETHIEAPPTQEPPERKLRGQVEELEKRELQQALEDAKGNRSKAAEKLGLSRFGLYKKMHRYGLS